MSQATVLYDYVATGDSDLGLQEGDVVTILNTDDSEWYLGSKDGVEVSRRACNELHCPCCRDSVNYAAVCELLGSRWTHLLTAVQRLAGLLPGKLRPNDGFRPLRCSGRSGSELC